MQEHPPAQRRPRRMRALALLVAAAIVAGALLFGAQPGDGVPSLPAFRGRTLPPALPTQPGPLPTLPVPLPTGPPPAVTPTRTPVPPACGLGWRVVPDPASRPGFAALAAVAGTARDLWAVGEHQNAGVSHALVAHWDGSTWREVASPSPARLGNTLRDVAVAAPDDVWAVGYSSDGNPLQERTLIEHWDGRAWSVVPSPNAGSASSVLNGVAVVAPNDVWAVGSSYGARGGTLVEHWNGAAWGVIPNPEPVSSGSEFEGLTALGADDIWAAGSFIDERGYHTLTEHWDGQAWAVVPSPDSGSSGSQLFGVAAVTSGDIWAVGATGRGSDTQPLIERWNGRRWSVVPSPTGSPGLRYLHHLAVVSGADIWAVGGSLIAHWDGQNWRLVLYPAQGGTAAFGGVVATAARDVWAVGLYSDGQVRTLAEEYSDPCAGQPRPPRPPRPADTATPPAQPSATSSPLPPNVAASPTQAAPTLTPSPAAWVAVSADPAVVYFPPVGHTLRGRFRAYWESHGGLTQFGFPLTEEFVEQSSTDGQTYTVQYFQRNRFEYHPEHAGTPYEVLLGLLGRVATAGRGERGVFQPLALPSADAPFFPPTGHSLAPEFAAYWQQHGGLAVYGYPISEPFVEPSRTDGLPYLVQYFERNRLEYHPELPPPFEISLGLLGVDILQARGWLP